MTVLVTGFGPFGDVDQNPSWDAVRLLAERRAVHAERLDVSFRRATARVRDLIAELRPDVVVNVGLAASRRALSLERVAVNLADARIPDVDGDQPVDEPAVPGAPTALLTTLPVKAIRARLRAAGLPGGAPVELSLSAGTYVCNAVMLAALAAAPAGTRAGFVHVPPADVLPPAAVAAALDVVVATALEVRGDLPVAAGVED